MKKQWGLSFICMLSFQTLLYKWSRGSVLTCTDCNSNVSNCGDQDGQHCPLGYGTLWVLKQSSDTRNTVSLCAAAWLHLHAGSCATLWCEDTPESRFLSLTWANVSGPSMQTQQCSWGAALLPCTEWRMFCRSRAHIYSNTRVLRSALLELQTLFTLQLALFECLMM